MVDVLKLKAKMVEKGFTVASLANAIEIDKTTLYRRFADVGKTFTIGEIERIVLALDLTEQEAREIFFIQSVA